MQRRTQVWEGVGWVASLFMLDWCIKPEIYVQLFCSKHQTCPICVKCEKLDSVHNCQLGEGVLSSSKRNFPFLLVGSPLITPLIEVCDFQFSYVVGQVLPAFFGAKNGTDTEKVEALRDGLKRLDEDLKLRGTDFFYGNEIP